MYANKSIPVTKNLYITLFEPQLIRTFLLADKSQFLKDLNEEFKVVIITSSELNELVKEGINKVSLSGTVSILNFDNYKDSTFTTLISFILYWTNKSPAIKLKIGRLWLEEKKLIKTLVKLVINKVFLKNYKAVKFLRFLFYKSIKIDRLKHCFNRSLNIKNSDLLFITSLTNAWEDLPIGVYFRKNNAQIVGTVRSWDNLTNHGYMKLAPDIFLSHSEVMLGYAGKFQCLPSGSVVTAVTPVYQKIFQKTKPSESLGITNIAYMCMGKSTNPDDENLVRWLINEWRLMPNNFKLTILQHPKFVMKFDDVTLFKNITIEVFRYENSNLIDYYDFIAKQDLIVCGGTTAALDAAFLGIPVAAIGFEIVKQNYWASALRYFDTKPHTKDFFENPDTLVIKSKDDFIKHILEYKEISSLNNHFLSRFTGSNEVDFNSVLLDVLKKLN
jgi:hypothetical protein